MADLFRRACAFLLACTLLGALAGCGGNGGGGSSGSSGSASGLSTPASVSVVNAN